MYRQSDCAENTVNNPASETAENGGAMPSEDGKQRKQILVVDDERPIRMLLQKILEANGYACRIAETIQGH